MEKYTGVNINNNKKVNKLFKTCLDILLFHKDAAIIKARAHEKINNDEAQGNSLADHFAKQATLNIVIMLSKLFEDKYLKEFKETIMNINIQLLILEKIKKKYIVLTSLR